jgi:hypothetical protein
MKLKWYLRLCGQTIRFGFHIFLCPACTHHFDGRVKLCPGGADAWLNSALARAHLED